MKKSLIKFLWGTLENVIPMLSQFLVEAVQKKKNQVDFVHSPVPLEVVEKQNTEAIDNPLTPSI